MSVMPSERLTVGPALVTGALVEVEAEFEAEVESLK
jgi:hypothetical protein